MRKDEQGSALLWAVMLCFVLLIVVLSSLGIAYLYEKRSLINHAMQQAELSARAATDGMVELLNTDAAKEALIPIKQGDEITITDIAFTGMDVNMGTGVATITRISDTELAVSVSITIMEKTKEWNAKIMQTKRGWKVIWYDETNDHF